MPPKAKITEQMVVDAAFEIAREMGAEAISARTVAQRLDCSTQPVMYHFERIEDLKKAAYAKADAFHTEYLMRIEPPRDIMLTIGLNYIRFAMEQPHLFRFLFQSGYAIGNNLLEMMDSEAFAPLLSLMEGAMDMSTDQTKSVFITIALFTHGYASLIANKGISYDEALVTAHLEQAYRGAVLAAQEGSK